MNSDKRQQIIFGLIVIVFTLMVWQIYKLSNANFESTVNQTMIDVSHLHPSSDVGVNDNIANLTAQQIKTNAHETALMLHGSNGTESTDVYQTVAHQGKYLALVNQYQLSEIQRLIADDEAAIAESRYKAAEALQQISQMSKNTPYIKSLTNQNDLMTTDTVIAESASNIIPLKYPDLAAAKIRPQSMVVDSKLPGIITLFPENTRFMQLDKNAYTIQIIADNEINSVDNFISTNYLQDKAFALKTLRNQKPWYIAVYGEYPSSIDAYRAIKLMPNDIQKERPFVRRVGEIQSHVVA